MDQPETELERFRKQWQEEVNKKKQGAPSSSRKPVKLDTTAVASEASSSKRTAPPPTATYKPADHGWEDYEPRAYHDLDEKETGRRLDDEGGERETPQEPRSALEHYEKAVERETQGSLGDSVSLYRKAFKVRISLIKEILL